MALFLKSREPERVPGVRIPLPLPNKTKDMSKLMQIRKDFLEARKTNNIVTKNLLSTFIGEVELSLKGENPQSEDVIVETLSKKLIKNATIVGSETSKKEIEILENYLPKMASKDEIKEYLIDKDLTLGGRLIGLVKQHFNGNVDTQIVKEAIVELS